MNKNSSLLWNMDTFWHVCFDSLLKELKILSFWTSNICYLNVRVGTKTIDRSLRWFFVRKEQKLDLEKVFNRHVCLKSLLKELQIISFWIRIRAFKTKNIDELTMRYMGKKEKSVSKKVFFTFRKKEKKISNGRGLSNIKKKY